MIGFGNQARAQWDLGTTVNPMASGGTGVVEGGTLGSQLSNNGGSSINQTYNVYNQTPTQYQGYGSLQNSLGQNQNVGAQSAGQQLSPTQTTRLSTMQNQGLINNLPKGLSGTFNGLPPTSLDSFVRNAGGHAEMIYGDEGTNSWPPLNGFGRGNTINAGIVGQRSKTLTTGHNGEKLPTASGNGTEKAP
jgi:hypothetical protein